MKKKVLIGLGALIPFTVAATAAMAASPIHLIVNHHVIQTDVAPQITNGRVLAPARAIAEALGASVSWDSKTQTVDIEKPDDMSSKAEENQFVRALAPTTPSGAVQEWATGCKTRNGALQYAAFSLPLKDQSHDDFATANWVTGTSSPWINDFKIDAGKQVADNLWVFNVQFDLRDSTTMNNPTDWSKIPPFEVVAQQSGDNWFVAHVTGFDHTVFQLTKTPDGTTISGDEHKVSLKDVDVMLERLGAPKVGEPLGQVIGNHANLLSSESVDLPLGKADLGVVERTQPAASNDPTVTTEYWVVVTRDDPSYSEGKLVYCLVGTVTGDKAAAKAELLQVAQTWQLTEELSHS